MGASDFTEYGKGADVKAAFEQASTSARYEYGSGGYTGTMAEKNGFQVVQRAPLPLPAAERLADKILSDHEGTAYPALSYLQDKWGDAGAIAVTKSASSNRERTVAVSIDSSTGNAWEDQQLLGKAALAKIGTLRAGEVVATTKVDDIVVKAKVAAAKTEGAIVKRYCLAVRHGEHIDHSYRHLPKDLFESQALARAAAVAWLKANPSVGNIELVVEDKMVREDGSPLDSIRMEVTKISACVTVTIEQLPKNAAVDGWLFFGFASS